VVKVWQRRPEGLEHARDGPCEYLTRKKRHGHCLIDKFHKKYHQHLCLTSE
jgi:hypothetical protein